MASFDSYQFLCAKCDEPLFSSLENSWLRVSKSHITLNPPSQIEALPSLDTSNDALSGSKELEDCEIQQIYCYHCQLRIGVKCIDASLEKDGFIGRYFLREAALAVNGLTAQWGRNSDPTSVSEWMATTGVALVVRTPSKPLPTALRRASTKDPADQPHSSQVSADNAAASLGLQDRVAQDEGLKALLGANIRVLGEIVQAVSSLREEISTVNQRLSRKRKRSSKDARKDHNASVPSGLSQMRNVPQTEPPPSQPSGRLSSQMDVDPPATMMNMEPPSRTPQNSRRIALTPSTFDTQQYLEQTVVSDDPHDSDFELSDASMAGRHRSTPLPAETADQGRSHQVPLPLTSNSTNLNLDNSKHSAQTPPKLTLHDLQKSSRPDRPSQFAIRGRSARRGVSGRRFSSDSPKIGDQALPTHLSRGQKALKLKTAHSRSRQQRPSGYQSSPLATSFSADDASESAAVESAASNSSASRSLSSPVDQRNGTSSIAPNSVGAMSHKDIMKLVKKGMNSDFAKSHLLRGPTRPSPTKPPSTRVALAS